jgi:hypothetical protein
VPSLVAGLIAGGLGWIVTDVSCRGELGGAGAGCPGWAALVGVLAFLLGTVGVAVVIVLVFRSLAEYREASARGEQPPGPGCEV